MNSELLKSILLFIAGGAAGAMVTGFVCKQKMDDLEESFEERVNDEVNEVLGIVYEGKKNERAAEEDNDEDPEMDEEYLHELSHSIVDAAKKAREKPDPVSYAKNLMEKNNYVSYSGTHEKIEKNEIPDEEIVPMESEREDIEIIAPDEFGEMADYEKVELYYLRDGSLVDDEGNQIQNIRNTIGEDSLENIGVYEPDSVYVRNHRNETDYAIFLKDQTLNNFSL